MKMNFDVLKNMFISIFKIIGIVTCISILFFFIWRYVVIHNTEWRTFEPDNYFYEIDGVKFHNSIWPLNYSRDFTLPYSTLIIKNPYQYEMMVTVDNKNIKSITFNKIKRILSNNEEIDFWEENIDGINDWGHNPLVNHGHFYDHNEVDLFRKDKKIEINSFESDYFSIMFIPVNIDYEIIDSFTLKIEIILEYNSKEKVTKEIYCTFLKTKNYKTWHDTEGI